jgi:hypothetical protein
MTSQNEGSFNGPDEGGLLGENTEFLGKNDRAPSEKQIRIDAARGHPFDPDAGPDSSGLTSDAEQQPSRTSATSG